MLHRLLLASTLLLLLPAAFAEDTVQYTGTYTNPEWEGGKMTIIIAKEATDGKRTGTVNCIWDGGFYTYPATFEPKTAEGVLQGICASEDGMGEPTNYVIKGTVDDEGNWTALYWVEGMDEPETAEDADGTITVKLGATPQVTEDTM